MVEVEGHNRSGTNFVDSPTNEFITYVPEAQLEKHKQTVRAGAGDDGDNGICGSIIWALSLLLVIVTFPVSMIFCLKVVQEYERAVVFRLGRLLSSGLKGPGLFFIMPCIDTFNTVDLRPIVFDLPTQEVLTKDFVTVAVDAVAYCRPSDPARSITGVENFNKSTLLLASAALRNVLGTKNLSEILSDMEIISHVMQITLDEATYPWGGKIECVKVKNIRLPIVLQRAIASEAEASREALAKVIAAEGECNAARALKEAADVICQSPCALQLRYLQSMITISAEDNSTIVFPLPIDFLTSFKKYEEIIENVTHFEYLDALINDIGDF